MADPLDELMGNPFSGMFSNELNMNTGPARSTKKHNKPLPKKEQSEAVKKLLNAGAGALQMTGDVLNWAGNHARGAALGAMHAAGVPGAPEHDWTKGIEGRPMLEKLGILGPNIDQSWVPDRGDMAGLAADIATDPLTYATFGISAVGKAGQAARGAGVISKGAQKYQTTHELVKKLIAAGDNEGLAALQAKLAKQGQTIYGAGDEALGGIVGFGVPGLTNTYVPKWASSKAAQAVGKVPGAVLGVPGAVVRKASPYLGDKLDAAGRLATALTDHEVMGMTDPIQQDLAKRSTRAGAKAASVSGMDAADVLHSAESLHKEFKDTLGPQLNALYPGMSDEELHKLSVDSFNRMTQLGAETRNQAGTGLLSEVVPGLAQHGTIEGKIGQFGKKLTDVEDKYAQEAIKVGIPVKLLQATQDFSHKARQASDFAKKGSEDISGLSTRADNMLARTPETKFIPAHYIDKMLKDPSLLYQNGVMRTPAELAVAVGNMPGYAQIINQASAASGISPQKVAEGLGQWIHSKGDSLLTSGKNLYTHDAPGTTIKYSKQFARATNNAKAIHDVIAEHAVAAPGGVIPHGHVSIDEAYKYLGWDQANAKQYLMNKHGQNIANAAVPIEMIKQAKGFWDKTNLPEWQHGITNLWDAVTKGYKAALTIPFPGFHFRNDTSGFWANMASNEIATPKDLAGYLAATHQFDKAVKDPYGSGANILKELVGQGVLQADQKSGDVAINAGRGALGGAIPEHMSYAPSMPIGGGKSLPMLGVGGVRGILTTPAGIPRAYRELRAAGKGVISSAGGAAPKALFDRGSEVARQIESRNRGTMYVFLRNKGWDPAAAAKRVGEIQVDYSKLSPAEKHIAKRVVPFYTFQRKSVPELLKNMYEKPGGLAAQTVRAGNRGRDEDAYIPSYVGEGLSIPTGTGGYLSEFGLPTDQLNNLAVKGPTAYGSVRRTGQKWMSQLHPLIKGPIEAASGTNMFSGKRVEDMYQYPFDSPLPNLIMGAMPSSRAQSTIRTILDHEKLKGRKTTGEILTNVLTGAHITHPSGGLEREAQYAAKKIASEIAGEDPAVGQINKLYVKEGRKLRQDTENLFRVKAGIERDLKQMNKKQKKKKASKAQ